MNTWGVHPLRGLVPSVLPGSVITYFSTQKRHVAPFLIFFSRVIRPTDRGFNPFPAKEIGLLTQSIQIRVSQRDLAHFASPEFGPKVRIRVGRTNKMFHRQAENTMRRLTGRQKTL